MGLPKLTWPFLLASLAVVLGPALEKAYNLLRSKRSLHVTICSASGTLYPTAVWGGRLMLRLFVGGGADKSFYPPDQPNSGGSAAATPTLPYWLRRKQSSRTRLTRNPMKPSMASGDGLQSSAPPFALSNRFSLTLPSHRSWFCVPFATALW